MALSPEIQAAIEKNLEQLTDLNALQDALKVLDPNRQLQAQQQEPKENSAENNSTENNQETSETTEQEEDSSQTDQEANDASEQAAEEQADNPQENQPDQEKKDLTQGGTDYSNANLKKLKSAWTSSKIVGGVKLDTDMLQFGLKQLQSKLTKLLQGVQQENEEIIVENKYHQSRDDWKNKEKINHIIDKSILPRCQELIRKNDITTVQDTLNLVTALVKKYEENPEKTIDKLTGPGTLKKLGGAIKNGVKSIKDTAKNLKNKWDQNRILKHVDSGKVSADDLEKAFTAAKTNKHKFGKVPGIDEAVREFQAALERNDYTLLESTMQLVKEMKEYQLLEKDQSYTFLKNYFAQINEDYQGLINNK